MNERPGPPERSFRAMFPSALWPIALMITIYHASGQPDVADAGWIPHFDKITHFFVFGLLAILVVRVVFEPRRPLRWALIGLLFTSCYGAFDEFRQSFTPGRSVEVVDWVADTLGAAIAVGTYCFWPAWRRLLERVPYRPGTNRPAIGLPGAGLARAKDTEAR